MVKTGISRPLLVVAMSIAILAVSTASILIRLAQRDASSLEIAAARLMLASAFLLPVALLRHRTALRDLRPREVLLAALAGVFLAAHFGTWISSLEYTTVVSSVVLVSTGPLWVALLSPAFLGERLTRSALFGLGLAILGGTVIAAGGSCSWSAGLRCEGLGAAAQGRMALGNLLALAGAWAVSGYLILGRRLRATVDLVPYIFLTYGFAALVLLGVMLVRGETLWGLPPRAYLWLLLLALIPQLVGHTTYNWALRFLPAALVAIATLGEPIGSAVLAFFILREIPGPAILLGGILILAGIYLAARGSHGSQGDSAT